MLYLPVLLGTMLLPSPPRQGTPEQDVSARGSAVSVTLLTKPSLREEPAAFQTGRRPLAEVPFTLYQNAVILPAVVNERDTVQLLLDTGGAGAFVAMPQLVERAGLRPIADSGRIGIGMLHGDTAVRQPVRFTRVGRVALGPFTVDSPRVMIAPPQMGGGDWGHDLVIGYGFLRQFIVTFDYPGRLVTLERPVPPQSGQPKPRLLPPRP